MERHYYFKVRIWHLIWLLILILLIAGIFWIKANLRPEITTGKPHLTKDGAVVSIQVVSRLPLTYVISPFYLHVKTGDTIIASAIAIDNPVTIHPGKPRKLVFDFKLDSSSSLMTKVVSLLSSKNLSISAEIPVRILGINLLIPYSKTLQL